MEIIGGAAARGGNWAICERADVLPRPPRTAAPPLPKFLSRRARSQRTDYDFKLVQFCFLFQSASVCGVCRRHTARRPPLSVYPARYYLRLMFRIIITAPFMYFAMQCDLTIKNIFIGTVLVFTVTYIFILHVFTFFLTPNTLHKVYVVSLQHD